MRRHGEPWARPGSDSFVCVESLAVQGFASSSINSVQAECTRALCEVTSGILLVLDGAAHEAIVNMRGGEVIYHDFALALWPELQALNGGARAIPLEHLGVEQSTGERRQVGVQAMPVSLKSSPTNSARR